MSNFKTQKLSQPKKIVKISQENQNTSGSKSTGATIKKWVVGVLIFVASILFVGNFALRAIGNISV
jgi:hypothetical protein